MTRCYFPDPPPVDAEVYGKLKIHRAPPYDDGRCVVKIWCGKAQKPHAHYIFKSNGRRTAHEARELFIEEQKQNHDATEKHRGDYRAKERDGAATIKQGLEVRVFSRTGGASWVAEVYDGSGTYRRDLMLADEGLDEPTHHLATATAAEIAKRLSALVREIPV